MALPEVIPHVKVLGKDVHWYKAELDDDSVSDSARQLVEKYSETPPDQVSSHIWEIRERAWAVFPYPCIGKREGQARFKDLQLEALSSHGIKVRSAFSISPSPQSPLYDTIVHRLIGQTHTFLDLGCCFVQGIRKVVLDGAPSENLYGAELRYDFIDLGYDLFRDRYTLRSKFITGDVLDDSLVSGFHDVEGRFDTIYAANFFHLFDWDGKIQLAMRVVKLMKPVKGSLLLGRQRGNVKPGKFEHRTNEKERCFGTIRKVVENVETGGDFGGFGLPQKGEDEHADNQLDPGG